MQELELSSRWKKQANPVNGCGGRVLTWLWCQGEKHGFFRRGYYADLRVLVSPV
jgi:hypothetical protein